jgi:BRCA1-associated protein
MPSYFFHLKFELYPSPARSRNKHQRPTTPHRTNPNSTFLPPPGADIFKTSLPAHKTSRWSSYTFPKHPATSDASPASGSDFTSSPRRQPPSDNPDSHGDALLLPERSLNLQHVPHSPALTPAKLSNEVSAKDWRYSAVSIESIDMELQGSASPVAASKTNQAKSSNGGLHTKALYLPSDPKTTEVGWGVVHLYRDAEETSNSEDATQKQKSLGNHTQVKKDDSFDPEDCTTLCILAVPSWMMPSDLLGFVGDQAREDVSHFRLIRTGRANKYMVLMKFRSAKKAKDWQKVYNGRLFSAAEPENCHVVFIKSVEFLGPDEADVRSFPHNANDPFTSAGRSSGASKSLLSKPFAPPPPNLLELPTCPVCLERMDETTGLLTILCQHVFHCACLEKWRGSGCPVCRYTHSPSYTFPYPRPYGSNGDDDLEPMCSVCASTSNVWVCLICGNLGCGRYDSAHAYAHYEETSHCYAMDISTQHVWDYAGDGYVHRLIQSKPDSRLIDLPERQRHENEAFRSEGGDSVPREKMESMAAEYTYLLTSQLEGQRRYFEEQVERAVDKASQASARADEAASHAQKAAQSASHHQQSRDDASAALARAEKALEKSERAREKFEKLARDMSSQLREEKTMNEGLLKRIRAADEKAENAKKAAEEAVAEKKELEEMVNDLTMFISSQEKVKELQAAGEEIVEGGDSGVVEGPKKKKGKGRKK